LEKTPLQRTYDNRKKHFERLIDFRREEMIFMRHKNKKHGNRNSETAAA